MGKTNDKEARVVLLVAVRVHILPRGPIEAVLLVPRSDMLQGIQMYSSSRGFSFRHYMPDKAIPVATASVCRVYGNVIHIPIPIVAFMKRNYGESYQVSFMKESDTLFGGPIAPRDRKVLLDRELFLEKRLLPNVTDRLGMVCS